MLDVLSGARRWAWLGQGTGPPPVGSEHPCNIAEPLELSAKWSRTCCVPTFILPFNLLESQRSLPVAVSG